MRIVSQIAFAAAFTVIFAASATAQDSPDPVGNPQPPVGEATVSVLSMEGSPSQFRTGPEAEWEALTADSKLGVGGEVRTGRTSKVKLQVGPNTVVELGPLSVLAIGDLTIDTDAGAIRTLLGQKYGNMKVAVHQVGNMTNDTSIAMPGQVLAVRGTEFSNTSYGSFTQTTGNSGNVSVNGKHGVGKGDKSSNKNPDPNQNASNANNQNKTSTPDSDGSNASGNNSNQGFQGLGAGGVKSQGDQYDSWNNSKSTFESMVPRDDHNGHDNN